MEKLIISEELNKAEYLGDIKTISQLEKITHEQG